VNKGTAPENIACEPRHIINKIIPEQSRNLEKYAGEQKKDENKLDCEQRYRYGKIRL